MLLRLRCGLFDGSGRDLCGGFRSNGRRAAKPCRQGNAGTGRQLRQNPRRSSTREQSIEQVSPLRTVGVAEELADHLRERRCLVGIKHRRETACQIGWWRGLSDLMVVVCNLISFPGLIRFGIVLQHVCDFVHPTHAITIAVNGDLATPRICEGLVVRQEGEFVRPKEKRANAARHAAPALLGSLRRSSSARKNNSRLSRRVSSEKNRRVITCRLSY
jgi:hypothetical protein